MSSVTAVSAHDPSDTEHRLGLETLYADNEDPWNYAFSSYELTKYAATLANLPRERYERGLEIGCSVGVFTEQAASRVDRLVAIDLAETAITRARERCAPLPGVELRRFDFIGDELAERFDVIFCAEVLYYVQPWRRASVARKIASWLEPDGNLVLVHAKRTHTKHWKGLYGEGGAERLHRLYSHWLGMPVVARDDNEQYEILVLRASAPVYGSVRRWAEGAHLTLLATAPQIRASSMTWLRRHPRLLSAAKRLRAAPDQAREVVLTSLRGRDG